MGFNFVLGKGNQKQYVELSNLNRHGFIAGSTGTGKTVTLKVMAENLSKNGVSVFVTDIKGDVSSIAQEGSVNESIAERINFIGLENFENRGFPVEIFDVFGEKGIPLRTTISEMGPILLSRLMGLNEIQEGVLNIAFKIADDGGLLLIDIKDLRSMLNFVSDNASELSRTYGNVSKTTVGAILRALLLIEEQGGDYFFGLPSFDVKDFIKTDKNGEGIINILSSERLFETPKLYATFLLWLLSELYENLEEVGNLEKPKIVFFFDEAHLIFNKSMGILMDKIEKVVRLIRSKGVGIFFVTQKATDISETVLSQLSNRIQHGLNAYTPNEQKSVKAIAESFRQDGSMDLTEEILNLRVGEAIVSVLGEDSKPTVAQKVLIAPPESKFGIIDEMLRNEIVNNSSHYAKYFETNDPESAFEILLQRDKEMQEKMEIQAQELALSKQKEIEARREEKQRLIEEKKLEREKRAKSKKNTIFDRFANNVVGSVGREVGRMITRGLFGGKKRYF